MNVERTREEGAERSPASDGEAVEARPINPLSALTLVLVFPRRTFERLQIRPRWVLPLVFVVAAVLAKSLLALGSGVLDQVLESEARPP